MLDALFSQSPVGLHLLDTELRIVRVNLATPSSQGVRVEDLVGHRFSDVYDMVDAEGAEELAREVLDSGVPLLQHIVRTRRLSEPKWENLYEASLFRLQSPSGEVLGLAMMVVDVTDQEKARARVGILDAVREHVGRTLDVLATCQELVDTLVPRYADVAIVEVVDAVIRGTTPRSPRFPWMCRCDVPRSAAAEARTSPRRIRWGTYAASLRRPPTPRRCPTCGPGRVPWDPICRGSRPTRPAPRRSAHPAPTRSSRPHWPCGARYSD
ncbi:PAS domain-containing protein [Peterkaempfera sp. SMS 1(5)a]